MGSYVLMVLLLLGALAAMPLLDTDTFETPPVGIWVLLAVAAVVMLFRGRRGEGD